MASVLTVLNEHFYGTTRFRTEDLATSTALAAVKPGEILNMGAGGSGTTAANGPFVFQCVDPGANGIGADGIDILMGIAKSEGDETASADGHVEAYIIGLGTRIKGNATTPGNMDTVSELDALLLATITIDGITTRAGNTLTTPYTFDENETSDPNVHAFQILQGDIAAGTLECRVVGATSMFGAGI